MLSDGFVFQAYELSTLTGTQVMLLVASETGHVYTFATRKLQPMITSDTGKDLIQMCLNSPDPPADPRVQANDPRGQPSGFEETDLTYSVDDEKVRGPSAILFGNTGFSAPHHSSSAAAAALASQMAPPPHPGSHHPSYPSIAHSMHPGHVGGGHAHHQVPVYHSHHNPHLHSPTQHHQAQYSPQMGVSVPPGMVLPPHMGVPSPQSNAIHVQQGSPSSTPSPNSMHPLAQHHIPCPTSMSQGGGHVDA